MAQKEFKFAMRCENCGRMTDIVILKHGDTISKCPICENLGETKAMFQKMMFTILSPIFG